MATRSQPPSQRDLELLSAYLDGELSDRERLALEKRLSQDKTLRAALDGLRETVSLVQSLPRLKAPRNFTLDPAVYDQPVHWWRLFTLGTAMQVSGALGAAASIVIIALAFLLSGDAENNASLDEPVAAEIEQTAVGFVVGTLLPSATQPPTVSPAASMAKAFTPTQTPLSTDGFEADDQGAFAADSAAMPTPAAEAAILIQPESAEPGAVEPPSAAGQSAEDTTSEESAESGLFAAAPDPSGTTVPETYNFAGEAESPMIASTSSAAPSIESPQESPAADTSLQSSPTPEVQPTSVTVGAEREKATEDETRQLPETQETSKLLIAGLGAVLLIVSTGLFIAGRRRR